MKQLLTLNKYFKKYKSKLFLGILFVVLSNIFRVLQPQAIREALNEILAFVELAPEARNANLLIQSLMKFGFYILLFAVLMGLFMFMMRQTIIVMSRLIEYDLRSEIFKHYLTLDATFFKQHKTGDLMSRIVEDVNKVRMYLGPALLYGINLISLVLIVIITMFNVNAKLSLFTLLPLPILSYIIYKVSDKIHRKSEVIQEQLAALTTKSQESFSGIRIVKSYATEQSWNQDFGNAALKYKSDYLSLTKIDALFFPSMLLLIGLSTLITIYVGGLNVYNGSVTAGNIAEFVIYVTMLTWPVSAIGWCASIIQQAEASQKRINQFLATTSKLSNIGEKYEPNEVPEFEFQNVCFTYPDSGIKALKNINLVIRPGQKVGLVGRTASGKTTIAELLLRIYDADQGQLNVGEKPLNSIQAHFVRSLVSYVPQDLFLFSDTVHENIKFGSPGTSQASIQQAATTALVHDDIEGFASGYQAILGERGVNTSGGQKQRIGLARALLKDSKLVIMDDCLSAVDSETELRFLNNLESSLNGRSLLFITQRIKQTRFLDYIYVLDHGVLVQEGSFDKLVSESGLFNTLYTIENQNKYQQ
ncbi:MAG: ABC transporter ATP-binding protein [Saprospiraceae bacterium]|nr:ABC transporter ATP-binding protein [Saprospiraceae bacterium]